jgi:uncharacterized protein YijF (DUF1287 family)
LRFESSPETRLLTRRHCLAMLAASPVAPARAQPSANWNIKLVAAAMKQIGVTVEYDPAYTKIPFPNGDVPRRKGVCTDVVIRAYRDAFGLDLQARVNADMRAHFSDYPKNWGLAAPDTNIDHRRVPNLRAFFTRIGASLPTDNLDDYRPGDLVTHLLPGNLPHIVIVAEGKASSGAPAVIHNIGAGARREDTLREFKITGRYRYAPA